MVKLYTDEYAANWDAFLADLDLPPLNNSQQSMQTLYVLSSPQSPMRDMLTAIVKQLTLTAGAAGPGDRRRRGAGGSGRGGGGGQQRDSRGCRDCWARRAHRRNRPAKRSRTVMTR